MIIVKAVLKKICYTFCQKSRWTVKICKCKALRFEYCCLKLYSSHIVKRNPWRHKKFN